MMMMMIYKMEYKMLIYKMMMMIYNMKYKMMVMMMI